MGEWEKKCQCEKIERVEAGGRGRDKGEEVEGTRWSRKKTVGRTRGEQCMGPLACGFPTKKNSCTWRVLSATLTWRRPTRTRSERR